MLFGLITPMTVTVQEKSTYICQILDKYKEIYVGFISTQAMNIRDYLSIFKLGIQTVIENIEYVFVHKQY